MTQEQHDKLKKYEQYLETAYYHDYVRTLPMSDAIKMNEIYNELTGRKQNVTCGKCVLQLCKTLGKLYFEYKNN
jgi:hypothetical protein